MNDKEITARKMARHMQLRYIHADSEGYSRIKKGGKFIYLNSKGKEIKSKKILHHISGLVLPPAWANVWICPYPNGHLQATGYDIAGRKQYRYHTRWSKIRNENKFEHMYSFGKSLPRLRSQIRRDLRKKTLLREKVTAIALNVMAQTFMRTGNTGYEKEYGSYGLTTLKNRHIAIKSTGVSFRFKGKKGIAQQIRLKDASLARLLKKVQELPGQELFQYYDETGTLRPLGSGDINDYLRENMGTSFTSKDFRTWAGSMIALQLMAENNTREEANKKTVIAIIDGVAEKLGNTRAVCRRYYIHPVLLKAYEQDLLDPLLTPLRNYKDEKDYNRKTELALLRFLKALQKSS